MPNLRLSLAIGDYDRTRPIIDGTVRIEGLDPIILPLDVEDIFRRAARHLEFDICELSLGTHATLTARGDAHYTAIPVFPARAFRHAAWYIRTDRGIQSPADLRHRRIGLTDYQQTAGIWARSLLTEAGLTRADITWVRARLDHPGPHAERTPLTLPPDIHIEQASPTESLNALLTSGNIDAILSPKPPASHRNHHPQIAHLYPEPAAAAQDYFRRTSIYPIMHLLALRQTLADAHPWLPTALFRAFAQSRAIAQSRIFSSPGATIMLPFLEAPLATTRALMTDRFYDYGLPRNRHVLETFLSHHHTQGLSPTPLAVETLFHPTTLNLTEP